MRQRILICCGIALLGLIPMYGTVVDSGVVSVGARRTPEEKHRDRMNRLEEINRKREINEEHPTGLRLLFSGGLLGNALSGLSGGLALLGMAPQIVTVLMWVLVIGLGVSLMKGVTGLFRT